METIITTHRTSASTTAATRKNRTQMYPYLPNNHLKSRENPTFLETTTVHLIMTRRKPQGGRIPRPEGQRPSRTNSPKFLSGVPGIFRGFSKETKGGPPIVCCPHCFFFLRYRSVCSSSLIHASYGFGALLSSSPRDVSYSMWPYRHISIYTSLVGVIADHIIMEARTS